jgi:arginine decarboxylase
MDQNEAPVLEAPAEHQKLERYGFTPLAHRQGRGVDARVLDVQAEQSFRSDVVAASGLDDRKASYGYLQHAESLMAEAVGADMAVFSTCGSSLSVNAAILALTRGSGELLIGRDAHKSVVSGLVLSGLQPRWIKPRWDNDLKRSHPPGPDAVEKMWQRYPDASAALVVSPTPYGTCADLEAIVEICHRRGKPLIVDEAWDALLPFHPDTPPWAMSAGADICVVSVLLPRDAFLRAGGKRSRCRSTRADRSGDGHPVIRLAFRSCCRENGPTKPRSTTRKAGWKQGRCCPTRPTRP